MKRESVVRTGADGDGAAGMETAPAQGSRPDAWTLTRALIRSRQIVMPRGLQQPGIDLAQLCDLLARPLGDVPICRIDTRTKARAKRRTVQRPAPAMFTTTPGEGIDARPGSRP